jgi:hypothetical protein
MSLAYYIRLDPPETGFDSFTSGKAAAQAAPALDRLCDTHGLPRLDSFFGQSNDEISTLIGEDLGLDTADDDGVQWFDPVDGLTVIEALMDLVARYPSSVPQNDEVLDDLEQYKEVLEQAQAAGARWHLALDL